MSHVATVTRIVGQLRVGAATGRRVPDVQVHVGAEGVKAGVLLGWAAAARLPAEGSVRGDRCRALLVEVALVGLALRGPNGAKQTGHGGEATRAREVWLGEQERQTETEVTK